MDRRDTKETYWEAPLVDDIEVYFNKLKGDVIPATKSNVKERNRIGYKLDISEYAKRKDDVQYEIYFTLTTKNGIKYITPYNPVATFRYSHGTGSTSSGEETLRPIFK